MVVNLRLNYMSAIRYLFHYLYHNGMISKETAHSIAGGFVFFPAVVVPIIFVVILLFSLRNATARTISIMNLILASGAILITTMAISGCHSAVSPSPPPSPHRETARGIIMDLVAVCWFAGALGLFSHKRLAWVGSIIGAGTTICFFGACFFELIALYLYPPGVFPQYNWGWNNNMVFRRMLLRAYRALSLPNDRNEPNQRFR